MAGRDNGGASGTGAWLAQLRCPRRITAIEPVAARFIYSLRLIAVHERARRDPVAELACRLGSVAVAVKALQLAEGLCRSWPEPISVRRFCCQVLSHDEATIAAMIEAAWHNRREAFFAQLEGLVRRDRIERLWRESVELAAGEMAQA